MRWTALLCLCLVFAVVNASQCTHDSQCCAGARCRIPKGGEGARVCVRPNGHICPNCHYGYEYRHGICTPLVDPCSLTPCSNDRNNRTVCLYNPKPCPPDQYCPQYKCVSAPACQIWEEYDNQLHICIARRAETVDKMPCRKCVFCVQTPPRCSPPCAEGETCSIRSQTCDNCPSAMCVPRDPIIENLVFDSTERPSSYNCVNCPPIALRCNTCPDGYVCEITPQTCSDCPSARCVPVDKEELRCPAVDFA